MNGGMSKETIAAPAEEDGKQEVREQEAQGWDQ